MSRIDRLKNLFRVHFDIPAVVILAVGFLLVHRPLAGWLFSAVGCVQSELSLPPWVESLAQGVASNILSALIIVPVAVWVWRIRSKAAAAGRFRAFVVDGATEEPWGEVALTYNLFSTKVRGVLTHKDIVINIDAVFDKEQYLRGYYSEQSNLARRRLGAFLLQLSGDGDSYRGPLVYVDPKDDNATPTTGVVVWRRVHG